MIGLFIVVPLVLFLLLQGAIRAWALLPGYRAKMLACAALTFLGGVLCHFTLSKAWAWDVLLSLCAGDVGCPTTNPAGPGLEYISYALSLLITAVLAAIEIVRIFHGRSQKRRLAGA